MGISTVKSALDGIASMIAGSSRQREQAKAALLSARNQLANLPSQYAAELSEISAFTPTGAFETLAKDEKAQLTTEFLALKAALESELTDLGVSF